MKEIHEIALPVLVDRLPAFSPHWPAEIIDAWFAWFFTLLDEAIEIQKRSQPREAVAADFGWETRR